MTLIPKNWANFQHYKGRTPPWIKLHRGLLDDYEFHCLPVASKALAPCLWLLASEYDDGRITASLAEIAFRFRMFEAELIDALKPLVSTGFFIDASGMLAACKHCSPPETEKEAEEEVEEELRPSDVRHSRNDAFGWPMGYREKFWTKYPHKVGRKPAIEKLDRVAKSGRTKFEDVMAGLDRYVRKTDDRPWCNPATWIFQERWNDQPSAPAERNGTGVSNGQGHGRRTISDALASFVDEHRAGENPDGGSSEGGQGAVRRLSPGRGS